MLASPMPAVRALQPHNSVEQPSAPENTEKHRAASGVSERFTETTLP